MKLFLIVRWSRIDSSFSLMGQVLIFQSYGESDSSCLLDHILIIVSTSDLDFGHCPFRFFNIWCQDKELCSLVENSWKGSYNSYGSLWDKLSVIKSRVSIWQKSKYATSSIWIKKWEGELASLLTIPIPSNEKELNSFRDKKWELSI